MHTDFHNGGKRLNGRPFLHIAGILGTYKWSHLYFDGGVPFGTADILELSDWKG